MRKKFIARQTSVCIGSNKSRTVIVRTFKNDLMRGGPPFAERWDAKGVTPLEATCCTSVTHDALIPSSVSEDTEMTYPVFVTPNPFSATFLHSLIRHLSIACCVHSIHNLINLIIIRKFLNDLY